MQNIDSHIIMVNHVCNLRCKYCFEHNKDNSQTDVELIKKYVEYIYNKNIDSNAVMRLMVFGGEPFLSMDALEAIHDTFSQMNDKFGRNKKYFMTIASNGTLLKEQRVQEFLHKYKHCIRLGFSIDGTKEFHDMYRLYQNGKGSYDDAIEGFHIAQKILPMDRIYAKATLSPIFLPRWSEATMNLIHEGFTNIICNYVAEQDIPIEMSEMLFNQFANVTDYLFANNLYRDVYVNECAYNRDINQQINFDIAKSSTCCCSMCNNQEPATTSLCYDGNLYPCHRFIVNHSSPTGKITPDGVVLKNQELMDRIAAFKAKVDEHCKDCDIKQFCRKCVGDVYDQNNGIVPENGVFKFYDRCGWTQAVVASWLYWKRNLMNVFGIKELENNNERTNKASEV